MSHSPSGGGRGAISNGVCSPRPFGGTTITMSKRDQEWRLVFGAALNDYCGESASVSGVRTSGKREGWCSSPISTRLAWSRWRPPKTTDRAPDRLSGKESRLSGCSLQAASVRVSRPRHTGCAWRGRRSAGRRPNLESQSFRGTKARVAGPYRRTDSPGSAAPDG